MNRKLWSAFVALVILSGCGKQTDRQPASNRLPTATEVFDLRSKCAAMGEKIVEDNVIGSALAQEQVSHYSPEANRCYVRLEVHTADLSTPQERFTRDEFLFDGQTKELLASASWKGARQYGVIGSDSLRTLVKDPAIPTYEETYALIDKFMAEVRRP